MELSARFNARGRIKARIRIRTYYSLQHIQSAALFTRQCYQIESNFDGTFSNDLAADHRSYVTGAIFAAVSFLEATINELFADTAEHPAREILAPLDTPTKNLMVELWKLKIPVDGKDSVFDKYSIIEKFQLALHLARKDLFKKGQPPYQDVSTLVVIRNVLIHYKPVWASAEEEQADKKILSLQQEKKFSLNPLISGQSNPFFPDKCLSYGCARWAVITSIQFAEEFFTKMGMPVPFDHIKPLLKTEP